MKLQIEQIELHDHLLIYSNYTQDSRSLDEDGADYEYDFKAFIANLDKIQNTVLRLYGEQGLLEVLKHFADGAEGILSMKKIEYQEDSPILKNVRTLQKDKNLYIQRDLIKEQLRNKVDIPSDDNFLLKGWLDALPIDDDLNVLKMVGTDTSNMSEEFKKEGREMLSRIYPDIDVTNALFFQFDRDSSNKYIIITQNQLFLMEKSSEISMIYPGNEFQNKQVTLFKKMVNIRKVHKLKNSVILDITIKDSNYLLLFDVNAGKFDSKKQILSL